MPLEDVPLEELPREDVPLENVPLEELPREDVPDVRPGSGRYGHREGAKRDLRDKRGNPPPMGSGSSGHGILRSGNVLEEPEFRTVIEGIRDPGPPLPASAPSEKGPSPR